MILSLIKILAPTKSDVTRNAEHKSCVKQSKTTFEKFTFSNRIAPAWNALSLTTESAPNIHNFKDRLDRDPKLIMNTSDDDS